MTNGDNLSGERGWQEFTSAFTTLSLFRSGPDGNNLEQRYNAKFELDFEILHLFPYINAEIKGTQFQTKPSYVKFIYKERLCILYPTEGAFTPVENKADAFDFLESLITLLLSIADCKENISPDYREYRPVSTVEILKILPGTNCRDCGFSTCLAFAAALSRQKTILTKCPYLPKPVDEKSSFKVMDNNGTREQTLSLPINTNSLYEEIERKDLEIKKLQDRLAEFELSRTSIEKNNANLISPLTNRELEVLEMIAHGKTNREISKQMTISEHTVKSHVIHIFDKLGVNDRAQASVWAAKNGLL